MSRTERRNYCDEWGRESRHWWGKRCPEPNCYWCVHGKAKRAWRRRDRHQHHHEEDQ